MKSINTILFSLTAMVLYVIAACLADTLTDILALTAGMVQSMIYIINLNNYPSVYFNLCIEFNSKIIPNSPI